jgi:tetrahydromethanopterin S-methyltransferase subunit G
MADDEHAPEQPDEPEKLMLVYLRRIDKRLDGIERKLDEVVGRLAAGERDFAAMQVRLDNLDRRVARNDRDNLQRELAKLAADIES